MGSGKTVVNIGTSLFLNIVLWASFLYPFYVEASVFSFISDLFSSTDASAEEIQPNSQNMALLQATISPNQDPKETKEEVVIVDGTSLLPTTQNPVSTETINEGQISLYVVRKGDTLPAVAKMFGVSVNTIKWGNDLKGNTISVDQTLVILPISGVQHTVKSGDTLQSIAKLYKGDLDEVLQYNNLSKNDKLSVGDVIVVPGGEVITTPSRSSGSGKKSPSYPVYEGYYMRPVVGGIRTQGLHDRYAVDLASSYGSSILASADGEVLISKGSGWNGGYGIYVVIKHSNGTQTLYSHISATTVSAGDYVKQGQVIGKMGNTGRVNGPTGVHLHFEIRGARNPF